MKVRVPPLETYKIIRDPLHGYIPLTKLEYKILQLPVMNRLHRIKQMSMAYLIFPGATSSRFVHCMGVMHVASQIIHRVLQSLESNTFEELFGGNTEEHVSKLVQTVRLAGLFHDLGHGPFSHAVEDVMKLALKDHSEEYKEGMTLLDVKDERHYPVHEYYSYKLITNGELKELLENESSGTSEDVACLIMKNKKPRLEFCTDNGLAILRKIVSSQLDADRMDFLLRDTYMTGVEFGTVDVQRVIMNLQVRKSALEGYEIAVHERALGSIEDMLDARFKMYKWVYNHHLIVATNELLKKCIEYLIRQKKLDVEDFYWKRFMEGRIDDEYVYTRLLEHIQQQTDSPFKGLLDRRYLPITLFKRPSDYKSFQREIMNKTERNVPEAVIKQKINKFFDQPSESKVQVDGEPLKALIIAANMPRAPYSELKPNDTVWICNDKTTTLSELTIESSYFEKINKEWKDFPSVYISYIIPGKTKEQAQDEYQKVRESVIEQIASFNTS